MISLQTTTALFPTRGLSDTWDGKGSLPTVGVLIHFLQVKEKTIPVYQPLFQISPPRFMRSSISWPVRVPGDPLIYQSFAPSFLSRVQRTHASLLITQQPTAMLASSAVSEWCKWEMLHMRDILPLFFVPSTLLPRSLCHTVSNHEQSM